MLIISFYLDLILSNFSFLGIPLFTLCYLLLKEHKYIYLISFIIGLIYDIVYIDTLILNGILFPILVYIHNYLKKYKRNELLMIILMIILYQTSNFLILSIVRYIKFDFCKYVVIVLKSLIANILYVIILKKVYLRQKHIFLNRWYYGYRRY